MKVLFVINGLGTGGAERSLAEMLPGLVDADVQFTIACLYRRDEGVERDVLAAGHDVRFLTARRLLPRARQLRWVLASARPDLVHTTLLESSLAGRVAAVGTGAPVLTSLVNTPYAEARLRDPNVRRASLAAVRAVDGWTGRHLTTHFHAITEAVRAAAVRDLRLRAERITVIERGRDGTRLGAPGRERRARMRASLGIEDDAPVVVAVGRQEHQKGHRYLLEAVPAVVARHPGLVVLIAGRRGHATTEVEQGAARAAPHVRLLGHRDDLPDVLAAADVFAFPSVYEGLGGAVIEAMALGLPVVASDLPALREVVDPGVNAVLVPPGDPSALASALSDVLADPVRAARMSELSRRIYLEQFTVERSTRRMLDLYAHVVAGARTGS